METARPTLIAIDGRSGSGKSTFATDLAKYLEATASVAILRLEDLYHGWDGLHSSFELYERILPQLAAGITAAYPTWDWESSTLGQSSNFSPAEIVVVEGVGALHGAARKYLDLGIWLEAPENCRRDRALARDGETYSPYWDMWAEQEDRYLKAHNPHHAADLVMDVASDRDPMQIWALACRYLPAGIRQRCAGPNTAPSVLEFRQSYEAPADAASIFEQLAAVLPHAALLESTSHKLSDPLGRNRYSVLALSTAQQPPLLSATSHGTSIRLPGAEVRLGKDFFRALAGCWPGSPIDAKTGYPLPAWVGYLGYELKREVGAADLQAVVEPGRVRPDAQFFAPDTVVVIDHHQEQMHLHSIAEPAAAVSILLGNPPELRSGRELPIPEFSCADTATGYKHKIRKAQREIYEGNTYEVCLTTELTAHAEQFDPFEAYCRMRRSSPAPFAHYLRFANLQIASMSPERFLALSKDGQLRAEPIKGTRPRGENEESDLALKHDLATHPKDRAENIMIVDLLRNDLSHHAVPGSVKVARLCAVESYATVHQMVSTIDATLSSPRLAAEALREAFPPGSMTGAPKLSTMNILDELEDHRARGLYSGAVGYLGADGAADFSVVIRTLVCDQLADQSWRLSLGLGGAITADSVPADEWDEVITKSRGVLQALGASFPDES